MQVFDWQEERLGAEGQSEGGWNRERERGMNQSDEWLTVTSIREVDVEPLDYDLDISREVRYFTEDGKVQMFYLSKSEKVQPSGSLLV